MGPRRKIAGRRHCRDTVACRPLALLKAAGAVPSGAAESSQRIPRPSPAVRKSRKSADVFRADLFDQGCAELIDVEDAEVFIEISEAG